MPLRFLWAIVLRCNGMAMFMLYPAIEYTICYNLAVFIPMKTAKSFILLFVAEYNKKMYDRILATKPRL